MKWPTVTSGQSVPRRSGPGAAVWYQRSAESGDTDSQYHMGQLCLNSKEAYCANSHHWLDQATQHGRRDAAVLLCQSDFTDFRNIARTGMWMMP